MITTGWREPAEALEGNDNVAIQNHGDPKIDYYVAILDADEPWLTVRTPFSCDGIFDSDGKPLEFVPGQRILKGYLYSLRNRKERKYERHDKAFAASAAASRFKEPPHTGWPVVYFPPEMIMHTKFHMIQPAVWHGMPCGIVPLRIQNRKP